MSDKCEHGHPWSPSTQDRPPECLFCENTFLRSQLSEARQALAAETEKTKQLSDHLMVQKSRAEKAEEMAERAERHVDELLGCPSLRCPYETRAEKAESALKAAEERADGLQDRLDEATERAYAHSNTASFERSRADNAEKAIPHLRADIGREEDRVSKLLTDLANAERELETARNVASALKHNAELAEKEAATLRDERDEARKAHEATHKCGRCGLAWCELEKAQAVTDIIAGERDAALAEAAALREQSGFIEVDGLRVGPNMYRSLREQLAEAQKERDRAGREADLLDEAGVTIANDRNALRDRCAALEEALREVIDTTREATVTTGTHASLEARRRAVAALSSTSGPEWRQRVRAEAFAEAVERILAMRHGHTLDFDGVLQSDEDGPWFLKSVVANEVRVLSRALSESGATRRGEGAADSAVWLGPCAHGRDPWTRCETCEPLGAEKAMALRIGALESAHPESDTKGGE